jgi:hypothetical protein
MNNLYLNARYRMVTGDFDWRTLDVLLAAWSGPYMFDEGHRTNNDVVLAGGIPIAYAEPNASNTIHAQTAIVQTNPILFRQVPIGPPLVFLTQAIRGINELSSELIAYYDTGEGLPYAPNGLDVLVHPDWLNQRGWFRA